MAQSTFEVIDRLGVNHEVVFRFFALFSRFEYALKRSGFLRKQDRAEPDWEGYAKTVRGRFSTVQDWKFKEACAYITNEPPNRQVVRDGHLWWEDAQVKGKDESDEQYVLKLVRAVRNNLFHGGKYPSPLGPMDEVARNRKLLEGSIIVLDQCLLLSPKVNHAFAETP